MQYNSIYDLTLSGKTVTIRTDINVPVTNNIVQDNTRIVESFKTVKYCIEQGAKKIIIIAHFGRPNGKYATEFSLKQIVPVLEKIYGQQVALHNLDDLQAIQSSEANIVLIENIRFFEGEEKNSDDICKQLATLGDFYINDAFSASHRAHASIAGIAKYTKVYAGILLQNEIMNIESILHGTPKEKICAIIGGSKVSTKFDLLNNLIHKVRYIVLGGGMANTFLYAKGLNVGKSLMEKDYVSSCLEILKKASNADTSIIIPDFVITAKEFKSNVQIEVKHISAIENDDIIVDTSLESKLEDIITNVSHVVWNGPLGAFEMEPFKCGTEVVARTIAKYTKLGKIQSIIGGGDVVSAINTSGLKKSMTYISTGGGAFLEWLEGKELPGITVCKVNYQY